jgi:gluconolactonase
VSVFRQPANNTNGHTVDRQGRLISCEHLGRRVTRTEFDGTITIIADRFQGKRLNSPNDVVVKSDNSIWFTDPAYGIDWDYEGERATSEIGACHVYRVDPHSGEVQRGGDRLRSAQRHCLFARRIEALRRRHRSDPCGGWPAPYAASSTSSTARACAEATCSPPARPGLFDGFRLR